MVDDRSSNKWNTGAAVVFAKDNIASNIYDSSIEAF